MTVRSHTKIVFPLAAVATLTLVLTTASARADLIKPTDVWTTSYFSSSLPAELINGSGLSEESASATHDSEAVASTMWFAGDLDGGLTGGTTAVGEPVVADQAVVFDLGATYKLSTAYIWNQNQNGRFGDFTGRGVDLFDIYVSSDTDANTASWTLVGEDYDLAKAGGTAAEPAQSVLFSADDVRMVKFDIQTAQSGLANEYVGLSEVRFESIPEPATIGILGFGAAALLFLRRRLHS